MNAHFFTQFLAILATLLGHSFASNDCEVTGRTIRCSGPFANDASLQSLKKELNDRYSNMYFEELMIYDTAITEIPAGIFAKVELEYIVINDNPYLMNIDAMAFQEQATKSKAKRLLIINNPLLKNNSLYELVKRLGVTDEVDITFNALQEVPSHAFNDDPNDIDFESTNSTAKPPSNVQLKKLNLSSNKIEHIDSNAFHLMESVTEIAIGNNQVAHIAKHGFSFATHNIDGKDKLKLTIKLARNKLHKDSFEVEFLELTDRTSVILDLSSNDITELKEEIFKPLLEKNVFIDLTDNKVNCQTTAWLKKEENTKLFLKTKGIVC